MEWAASMSCERCTDPDGIPCMPIYGLGPHAHTSNGIVFTGAMPPGYTPDPDEPNMGVYWCPKCGEGKPQAKETETDTITRLQGEAKVLRELLNQAADILATIDPDDADEGDRLETLIDQIEAAL